MGGLSRVCFLDLSREKDKGDKGDKEEKADVFVVITR
jgi:hypothetical protein